MRFFLGKPAVRCGYDLLLKESLLGTGRPCHGLTKPVETTPFLNITSNNLEDDFYTNTLDWSGPLHTPEGTVVFGGGEEFKLFCPEKRKVLHASYFPRRLTSLKWAPQGQALLGIGCEDGSFYLNDFHAGCSPDLASKQECRPCLRCTKRIIGLSWRNKSEFLLSAGRSVYLADLRLLREGQLYGKEDQLCSHSDQICGVVWNKNERYFATGGNDNILAIWDIRQTEIPVQAYEEHTAAVRAIAWSPFQENLLISAGGVADKTLRLWDMNQDTSIQTVPAGSQVCALQWSAREKSPWWSEVVTAHGFSENDVRVWRARKKRHGAETLFQSTPKAILQTTEAARRVLHIALSPCGRTAVAASAGVGLFFWNLG